MITSKKLEEAIARAKAEAMWAIAEALEELRERRASAADEGIPASEMLRLMPNRMAIETAVTLTANAIADWLREEASRRIHSQAWFDAAAAVERGEWRPKPPENETTEEGKGTET